MSVIVQCGCTSDSKGNKRAAQFQDRQLGQGRRYYTTSPTGGKEHCTVCGKERIRAK